jgi:DNA-directed RNA polymerase, mitochondrial
MTTVYNVTFYGARLQISRQLDYINDFPADKTTEASLYLATKTFESIRQLFFAAKDIQDWLSNCAVLISKERNKTVKWLTPLGLPISQPYFKKNSYKLEKTTEYIKFILLSESKILINLFIFNK